MLEVEAEIGLNFRYWHVMDSGRDSVDLLKRLLDKYATHFNYTLVLNQVLGDDFRILDASGEKERPLSMGAGVITLRRLHEVSMNKIHAGSLSLWAVANKSESDSSGLRLLERQRVKMWLKRAFAEIAKAGV